MGEALIYSYDHGKKEIFNYIKSLFTPPVLMMVKKLAEKNPATKRKLEYYYKTL